jgi:hypothetical protein
VAPATLSGNGDSRGLAQPASRGPQPACQSVNEPVSPPFRFTERRTAIDPSGMGFNRRKVEDQRRDAAQK